MRWTIVAVLALTASCAHVHRTWWVDDEVTPVEGSRVALARADDPLVRIDWAQLASERELVVSTWHGTPFEEDVDYRELVRRRVTSWNVGHVFLKAFVLPFYLAFLGPLWGGEDHHRDGTVGPIDKTIDFVAWVNPLQAAPIDSGTLRAPDVVDEGRRRELVYTGRPAPFATVRVELEHEGEVLALDLVTGADGTIRLPVDSLVRPRGRWTVRATWTTPRGVAEVGRSIWL